MNSTTGEEDEPFQAPSLARLANIVGTCAIALSLFLLFLGLIGLAAAYQGSAAGWLSLGLLPAVVVFIGGFLLLGLAQLIELIGLIEYHTRRTHKETVELNQRLYSVQTHLHERSPLPNDEHVA